MVLGGLAHGVEAHSFAGPLVVLRTCEPQLFLFLDQICLAVFPEQGPSAVARHLIANNWQDPHVLERYRSLPRESRRQRPSTSVRSGVKWRLRAGS